VSSVGPRAGPDKPAGQHEIFVYTLAVLFSAACVVAYCTFVPPALEAYSRGRRNTSGGVAYGFFLSGCVLFNLRAGPTRPPQIVGYWQLAVACACTDFGGRCSSTRPFGFVVFCSWLNQVVARPLAPPPLDRGATAYIHLYFVHLIPSYTDGLRYVPSREEMSAKHWKPRRVFQAPKPPRIWKRVFASK